MSEIPMLPPLPTQEKYDESFQSINGAIIKHPSGANGILTSYARSTPSMRAFYSDAEGVGHIVDKIDRSFESVLEDTTESAKAYALGSVAGMLMARDAHSQIIFPSSIFDGFRLKDVAIDPNDRLHTLHLLAEEIMDIGGHGLAMIGEDLEGGVDGWAEQCAPKSVDDQRLFKIGSGVVLFTARYIHADKIQKQNDELAQLEASKILASLSADDWDSGLEGLLNSGH